MFLVCFTAVTTLAVAFVNGFTDAPNAIASCVSTGCMKIKNAVLVAATADFAGAIIIGALSNRVSETVINIVDFGDNKKTALIALCSAMCSVVIWAVSAWRFGIPTSESHALIASLSGASVAVNGGFYGINPMEWNKVINGLLVSVFIGFVAGFIISKITVFVFKKIDSLKKDKIFRCFQISSSILMAFMHGAQDSQKFAGILSLIISVSGKKNGLSDISLLPVAVSSIAIAAGTSMGGERIIKTVGTEMVKLRIDQGFSSDLAGAICLFISTFFGFPVSTTHTKTSAVIGVGVADNIKSVNLKIAGEMIAAWLFTFPGCGLLGWGITCLLIKIL